MFSMKKFCLLLIVLLSLQGIYAQQTPEQIKRRKARRAKANTEQKKTTQKKDSTATASIEKDNSKENTPKKKEKNSIPRDKVFKQEVVSKNLKGKHMIKIFIPKEYQLNEKKFSLAIVLDADDLFDTYVGISKMFNTQGKIPNQIIIGVPQTLDKRIQSYGYNTTSSYPTVSATDFFNFIDKELIAFMKKNYRIGKFKTIVGKDLTANFTNYFMFKEKPTFSAYLNINPAYAPRIPEYLQFYISRITENSYFYYLSHGKNSYRRSKEVIDLVNTELTNQDSKHFNYKYEYFDTKSDLVSTPQSIAQGLDFIFSLYSGITKDEYNKNVVFLSPVAAMEYLVYKYENINYIFGEELNIRIEDFYAIEQIVMDKEEAIYLKEFGEMALKYHPESPAGNYYLGQHYERNLEYNSALISYKKGFSKIKPGSPFANGYYKNVTRASKLLKASSY